MTATKHFSKRMNQRGITGGIIDLVYRYGRTEKDKLVLDRKGAATLLDELRCKMKYLMKIIDKGGVVVVEDGDSLITTYNVDSYSRKKARCA